MRTALSVVLVSAPLLFGQTFQRTDGILPRSVSPVAGDFDGDGFSDLIEVGGRLFLGNGDGSFRAGVTIVWPAEVPLQTTPVAFAVADFDRNGYDDLIFSIGPTLRAVAFGPTGATSIPIAGFLSLGFGLGDALLRPVAADLDGDGWDDFILTSIIPNPAGPFGVFTLGGPPRILRNLGGWTFAPVVTASAALAATHTFVADVDGDALLDIVCVQREGFVPVSHAGGVVVLRQGPALAFNTIVVSMPGLAGSWTDAALGDITGDGRPDLYLARDAMPGDLLVNQGSGTFVAQPGVNSAATFVECRCLDWNGDSDTELILVEDGALVRVHDWSAGTWTGGLQAFGPPPAPALTSNQISPARPFAVDIDGDARPDLVGPGSRVLLNPGIGAFLELTSPIPPGLDSGNHRLGDLNGDGFLDTVSLAYRHDQILFGLNEGGARWNLAPSSVPPVGPLVPLGGSFAEPIDLDGDQDLDLFVANVAVSAPSLAGPGRILRNDGNLNFSLAATLPPRGALASVIPFDRENDGDTDLILVHSINAGVPLELLTNQGGFAFTPSVLATGPAIGAAHPVDYDSDGDQDVLVAAGPANQFPNTIFSRLLINDGFGNFSPNPAFPNVVSGKILVNDFNGDGRPDFVIGTTLILNLTNNLFVPSLVNGTNVWNPEFAGDVDQDGSVDLVYSGASQVAIYSNNGFGIFTLIESSPFPPNGGRRLARPADVDRDGDIDLDFDILDVRHQLLRDRPARLGRPVEFALGSTPGSAFSLFLSPGRVDFPFPPFGTVFIDPATLIPLANGFADPAGRARVSASVPLLPAFLGLSLHFQAVFWDLPRLSGLDSLTIQP